MGDLLNDLMRYEKDENWERLDTDGEKIVFGRLKALEELAVYIDTMNGANNCENDDDLKDRWRNITLDNSDNSENDKEELNTILE
mgnify:CR=1 FL=1